MVELFQIVPGVHTVVTESQHPHTTVPILQPKLAQTENHESTMHTNLNTTIQTIPYMDIHIYMDMNYMCI